MSKKIEKRLWFLISLGLATFLVVGILCVDYFYKLGSFNFSDALFSGLAFVGVIVTLIL